MLPSKHSHDPPPSSGNRRLVLGLTVFVAAAGVGFAGTHTAVQWRDRQQLAHDQSALSRAVDWRWQQRYSLCIEEMQTISSQSTAYAHAQELLYDCRESLAKERLDRAETFATQGEFQAALIELNQVPAGFYQTEVQQRTERWSRRMLEIAEETVVAGDLNAGLAIANSLPANNPLQPIAQSQMEFWQSIWQTNQQHQQGARIALELNDIDTALSHVRQMQPHPHWDPQIEAITQQIYAQQHEFETRLLQAQQALWQNQWKEATRLLAGVPDLPRWTDRKAQLLEEIQAAQQFTPRFDWVEIAVSVLVVMSELLAIASVIVR